MATLTIDLVGVYDKSSHEIKVFYLSEIADANCPLEWWLSDDGQHSALFHQDAYYDESLRNRRQQNMMICPQDKTQRLHLIGQIHQQIDLEPTSFVELFRNRIILPSTSVDEKYRS